MDDEVRDHRHIWQREGELHTVPTWRTVWRCWVCNERDYGILTFNGKTGPIQNHWWEVKS